MKKSSSVLEFIYEKGGYPIAKCLAKEIYMAESGNSFYVYDRFKQTQIEVDSSSKDAVEYMKNQLLSLYETGIDNNLEIYLDKEYLSSFHNFQLDEMSNADHAIYKEMMDYMSLKDVTLNTYINLDDISKLNVDAWFPWKDHSRQINFISVGSDGVLELATVSSIDPSFEGYKEAVYKKTLLSFLQEFKPTPNRELELVDFDLTRFESLESLVGINVAQPKIAVNRSILTELGSAGWRSVHFVASQSNWEEELTEAQRTFKTHHDEKVFVEGLGGYSMFSTPVDKQSWFGEGRVMPMRMENAEIEEYFFTGDDLKQVDVPSLLKEIKSSNELSIAVKKSSYKI